MSRKARSLGCWKWPLSFALILFMVALGAMPAAAAAAPPACENTYTGSGDWSVTAKWSKTEVPSSAEVACIEPAAKVTVTGGTASAKSIQGGALEITGGTLALASESDESVLTELIVKGGTLEGPAKIALSGKFEWAGTEASSIKDTSIFQAAAQPFEVKEAGVKTLLGKAALSTEKAEPTGGPLVITSASTLTATSVTLGSGTLQVDGTLAAAATLTTGGKLKGTGKVTGSVTNTAGTVEPGDGVGTLEIGGEYKQSPGGTLAIEVEAPSGSDKLAVKEAPSLVGTLSVSQVGEVAPEIGKPLTIVTTLSTPSGEFKPLSSPAGTLYSQVFGPSEVLLTLKERTPRNSKAPSVSGTLSLGSTLTCTEGNWEEEREFFEYQWFRDSGPTPIATTHTYVVQAADQGHELKCAVAAHNAAGTSPFAPSNNVAIPLPAIEPTPPAPPTPPVGSGAPTVAGIFVVGQVLTCQPAAWSGSPTAVAYQWYRDGAPLAGATGAGYAVVAADQAHAISCSVVGSNGAGKSAAAMSASHTIARLTPLPLACSKQMVQLLSIRRRGGALVVTGVALARYAGQKVTIKATSVPRGVTARGGAAVITTDGMFVTRVRAPRGSGANRTRYVGTLLGSSSPALALKQPLQLLREAKVTAGLRLTFKGIGALAKGRHKVTITRQVSCARGEVLTTTKLGRGGSLTVTLPKPEPGALAFYTVQTPVSGYPSYSVPVAVHGDGG